MSPRPRLALLALSALCAAAQALPATDKPIPKPITTITNDEFIPVMPAPWFSVPYFGDITKIFAPLWKLFPSFEEVGPRIVSDENKFQVIVQVKDYARKDLKVKVKGDFIFVQGTHETKDSDHDLFASQFFHTYTLPANTSGADVTAELTSDGYLVVNAPISGRSEPAQDSDREVAITETGAPLKREPTIGDAPETPAEAAELPAPKDATEQQAEISSTSAEPELTSAEDRREPTTPPGDREDITENSENVIPHGSNSLNEVTP